MACPRNLFGKNNKVCVEESRTLINETHKSPPYKSFYNKYILKIKIFILVISVDYLFK